MVKMYYEKDADLKVLKNKTIAIIGYGSQGHGQAQNLRDSKVNVIVSDVKNSPNWKRAKRDGFEPLPASTAAKDADIIQILTQDDVQARLYKNEIRDALKPGKAIVFSHGFNIHYGQIVPPENIDVFMIAPKGPGALVREVFVSGGGVPCLIAIYQNATGKAKKLALAYAKAIGGTRAGVIETTFAEETETDLFGEQAVLCGGLTELIRAGFDTLTSAGYAPEMAYFECLHEVKLITDLIQAKGIAGMRANISDTAEYGDLTRGRAVVTEDVRGQMKNILKDIQSGEFAREWILENQANRPVFNALRRKDKEHLIEKVGRKLRGMMKWM